MASPPGCLNLMCSKPNFWSPPLPFPGPSSTATAAPLQAFHRSIFPVAQNKNLRVIRDFFLPYPTSSPLLLFFLLSVVLAKTQRESVSYTFHFSSSLHHTSSCRVSLNLPLPPLVYSPHRSQFIRTQVYLKNNKTFHALPETHQACSHLRPLHCCPSLECTRLSVWLSPLGIPPRPAYLTALSPTILLTCLYFSYLAISNWHFLYPLGLPMPYRKLCKSGDFNFVHCLYPQCLEWYLTTV